jgi:hypothetical protein
MKQSAGQFGGGRGTPTALQETVKKLAPVLKKEGLTPFQGLLQAICSDQRIATTCVMMNNTDQVCEDVDAARRFEPLRLSELNRRRDASLAANPTFCADREGRCARAGRASALLGGLTHYLTYYEHHGYRGDARRFYTELTAAEHDCPGANLEAARGACPSRLDFSKLLLEIDGRLV